MKVVPSWINTHLPFLNALLQQAGVSGRKKIALKIHGDSVSIHPPFHSGVSRFTSMGRIGGKSITHFAGSDDTAEQNPRDLIAADSDIQGKSVNPGCYYAIFDKLEAYGHRELTVWFNRADLVCAVQEVKNAISTQTLIRALT